MDYAQQQRNPAKHMLGLSAVVLLHVIAVYALVNGLAHKIVEVVRKPLEATILEEHKVAPPPQAPPPPPPVLAAPPPLFIPAPEIQVAVAAPTRAVVQQVGAAPPPPVPVKAFAKVTTKASLDRSACATFEPHYPAASRRNQEAGTLILHLLIDADGKPGRVEVFKSSGFSRLDESARLWILSCRFKPSTLDGRPVSATADQTYTFSLQS